MLEFFRVTTVAVLYLGLVSDHFWADLELVLSCDTLNSRPVSVGLSVVERLFRGNVPVTITITSSSAFTLHLKRLALFTPDPEH